MPGIRLGYLRNTSSHISSFYDQLFARQRAQCKCGASMNSVLRLFFSKMPGVKYLWHVESSPRGVQ